MQVKHYLSLPCNTYKGNGSASEFHVPRYSSFLTKSLNFYLFYACHEVRVASVGMRKVGGILSIAQT